MMRRSALLTGLAIVTLLPAACTDSRSNPVAVNSVGSPSFDRDFERDDDDDGDFLRLVSVIGPGKGRMRATRVPHPTIPGNFAAHFEVMIRHASPNTSYSVQRAPETVPPPGVDPATTIDGSCQRGLAMAPWSTLVPAPAAFVTFPDHIITDGKGNGTADFVFASANVLPLFDVMFRVIEDGPAPKSVLQTDCTVLPLL